jgi:hypothetical protein
MRWNRCLLLIAADVLKLRNEGCVHSGAIPIGDDRGDASLRLGDNASLELDEMIRFVRQEIAHL